MDKKFGHWNVTEKGIEWDSEARGNYFIDSMRLLELTDRKGVTMYDWLVHVPPKTWVTKEDAMDLNSAFKYLASKLDMEIDENIYADSLEYQKLDLDRKPK